MENHHAIHGKIHYTWPFSIAMLVHQRVTMINHQKPHVTLSDSLFSPRLREGVFWRMRIPASLLGSLCPKKMCFVDRPTNKRTPVDQWMGRVLPIFIEIDHSMTRGYHGVPVHSHRENPELTWFALTSWLLCHGKHHLGHSSFMFFLLDKKSCNTSWDKKFWSIERPMSVLVKMFLC